MIEGELDSYLGRHVALATLPGAVVGRRYGKLKKTIAAGAVIDGEYFVMLYSWLPHDIDWSVSTPLHVAKDEADVMTIELGSVGGRKRLLVVMTNGTLAMYSSFEIGSTLTIERNNLVSFAGKGNSLALATGPKVSVYNTTDGNFTLQTHDDIILSTNELFVDISEADIEAAKLSDRGYFLSLVMWAMLSGEPSSYYISTYAVNGTSLIPKKLAPIPIFSKGDMSEVEFTDDAITVAVRVKDTEIMVFTSGYEEDTNGQISSERRGYHRTGDSLQVDRNAQFSLSENGPTVAVSTKGHVSTYSPPNNCGKNEVKVRLSISLDDFPDSVSWKLETLISFGDHIFASRVDEVCENCYFPRESYRRTRVTEIICVPQEDTECLRLSFENSTYYKSGEGVDLAVILNGT